MSFYKLLIASLLVLNAGALYSQNEADLSKRSEVKINGLYLLLGAFEVDYEYIINEESSFGVSLAYVYAEPTDWRWGITPHYRLFFGNQTALGFFVEGSGTILRYRDYDYIYDPTSMTGRSLVEDKVTAGLGLAVGGKFKTSRDVVVEVYAGIGRIIGESTSATYPRLGINFGKRF